MLDYSGLGVDACFEQVVVGGVEPRIAWSRQVSARRSTSSFEPLTRFTVACHVAKTVWQCISSYGGRWTLQDGTVLRYEDLVLLELVQVSAGSHQIVLGYLEPRTSGLLQSVHALPSQVTQHAVGAGAGGFEMYMGLVSGTYCDFFALSYLHTATPRCQ